MITKAGEELRRMGLIKEAVTKWKEMLAGLGARSRELLEPIAKSEEEEVGAINRGTFRILQSVGYTPKLVTKDSPEEEKELLRHSGGYCAVTGVNHPLYRTILFQDHRKMDVVPKHKALDASTSRDMADALGFRHEAYEALEAEENRKRGTLMESLFVTKDGRRVGKHTSPKVLARDARLRNQTFHADKAEGVDYENRESGIAGFLSRRAGKGKDLYSTAWSNKDYEAMGETEGYTKEKKLPIRGRSDILFVGREYEV